MPNVTIYYMQMLDRDALRPKVSPVGLTVECVDPPDGEVNKRYYEDVGRGWAWTDRLGWSHGQWVDYARGTGLSTWIGRIDGREIGYAEIEVQADGDVQICYFGLLPGWIGKGLGGAFLSRVVEIAWGMDGAKRAWLHTCTGDHPNALGNYEARGFEVYRTVVGKDASRAPGDPSVPGL